MNVSAGIWRVEESLSHLLFTCPFAQACWVNMNIVLVEIDPILALEQITDKINLPFFMDITITFC